ncbi:MAG: lactate dehydrogenase [Plectolyngbya sp. WJT66-NPBG17]|jgi:hypothetical protein|nr:lactate dehydrogenase [Plectolyngbya sp. WJT66-NPBG17]
MNAVEIEEAVSRLAEAPFDPGEFPFAFLEAFGNKPTTIKRLKSSGSNQSDLPGGVLQRNNIHLKVCPEGEVTATLTGLRDSPATARYKAKFILATDGKSFEAENLGDGETVACDYPNFPDHFGFFLPLAGITTVRQIRENAFDIKATGRLNRLYVELLKENPDWDTADRREAFNHFMARLIFCFFAEDTNIFHKEGLFTQTVAQMSAGDSSNAYEVLSEIFRAMCTPLAERESAKIRAWANVFPYVNGGLFAGGVEVPRFSKIARSYLLHVGSLDWTKINPDIFGSMIQAVADEKERGALGMHYTSVPNILKVLNPLFLDDLRTQLEEAGDNPRKLLNLRKRMARIRVFDPACGSGNFLVIAYKEMRAIEAEINLRRGEPDLKSEIPLTNFRGIELRHFSAEVARLALIIAEYQCDVLYLGQLTASELFLPLKNDNWITCGNALRLDWLSVCPPTGTEVKIQHEDLDLFSELEEVAEVDFENEGGETFICGNPPYKGGTEQKAEQKADMSLIFDGITKTWKSLDYVSGWFYKFALYAQNTLASCAFVSTNSICQGEQVARLWPLIFSKGQEIIFAHTSFKWANLAAHKAGVTVVIIGLSNQTNKVRVIYQVDRNGESSRREVENINAYLVPSVNVVVQALTNPISNIQSMTIGSKPVDGGNLILTRQKRDEILASSDGAEKFLLPYLGAHETIQGTQRYCIWVTENDKDDAYSIEVFVERFTKVREMRLQSTKKLTQDGASEPFAFQQVRQTGEEIVLVVPSHSSEARYYLPISFFQRGIISNSAFGLLNPSAHEFSVLSSRLHLVWIAAVCGKLKTDFRYSNTLGWNTFPVPTLTDQNKADLTRCAEDILLAREHYFPATIADMYDPDRMDTEFPLVREAHDRNDEVLERIYIGRRFKNDTERLEKLFELYTKMTTRQALPKQPAKRKIKGSNT